MQFASHVVHDAARDRELFAQLSPARHGYYYAAAVYELAGGDVLLDVYRCALLSGVYFLLNVYRGGCILFGGH